MRLIIRSHKYTIKPTDSQLKNQEDFLARLIKQDT